MDARCPCGGPTYESCCGRFHAGAEPETAEQLMRSRYAAFVKKDAAYLWKTLHAEHDDKRDEPIFLAGMRRHFASRVAYVGLAILGTTPPDAHGVATVTFRASTRQAGKPAGFTECSSFVHDGTGWRYLAGEMR